MSYHWLDDADLPSLTDEDLDRIKTPEDVWNLHYEWKRAWSDRTEKWNEANRLASYLARRTGELTKQIEALKEELYQLKQR